MNQVIHGDCLEVMPTLPDKSIDMILCDLPYGTTACKWDTVIPFEPLWFQYKRLIKDNGAIVLTTSQPFTSALVMSNFVMFRHCWVWDKGTATNFQTVNRQPMRYTEDILVFAITSPRFYPIKTQRVKPKDYSQCKTIRGNNKNINHFHSDERILNKLRVDKYPSNLIRISSQAGECNNLNRLHPTQKPVALFEYLIKTYTNEGETVLDNCAGSGTTAIACLNTNRNYILIEKEKEYIDIINKRISEHEQQLALC